MKKNYLQICSILLVLMLILGACGSNPTPAVSVETEASSEASEETSDNIIDDGGLLWDVDAGAYLIEEEILNGSVPLKLWFNEESFTEAVVAGFTSMYPDVRIEVQSVIPQDALDKIVLEGEAGTGADVFFLPHDHVGNAHASSALGMMGRYEDAIRERILESAVNTIDIDGHLWGIPFNTESIAFYYNKTLLNELYSQGIVSSSEPATDWEEIIALSEKYNDVQQNRWTIRWQVEQPYYNYMFLTAFGYNLFGASGVDPDAIGFDTQETLNGLNFFRELRNVWNINSGDSGWDATTMEFAKGETPYLISGPWSMEPIREGAQAHDFEFGVTTIPLMEGRQPYTFSGVNIVCVSPYSNYPGAARALAMYITSDEMLSFAYKQMGRLPALNDVYAANIEGLKDDMDIRGFMAQAGYSNAMPSIPEMSFFWSTSQTMFETVWDGLVTPDEAVANAMEQYEMLRTIGE